MLFLFPPKSSGMCTNLQAIEAKLLPIAPKPLFYGRYMSFATLWA